MSDILIRLYIRHINTQHSLNKIFAKREITIAVPFSFQQHIFFDENLLRVYLAHYHIVYLLIQQFNKIS